MNHSFTPSQFDALKCAKCKYALLDHTPFATCEACSNSGNMEIYVDMLMCPSCIEKEILAQKENNASELQEQRVQESRGVLNINSILDQARAVDYSVQIRTDIFNAETVAISEIEAGIDTDTSIPTANKQFEKAKFLQERYEHLKKVIFEAQSTAVEAQNKQRVVQQELNTLANTLRAEEREKLKLILPNYKPGAVIKPARTKTSKKPTFDKIELVKQVDILHKEGFAIANLSMLQMTCVSRGMTPSQAADVIRKTLS